MVLGNLVILNNKGNRYAIVDIVERVREAYGIDDSEYNRRNTEGAYAIYRILTGASIQESWRVVKPWIKIWEGK